MIKKMASQIGGIENFESPRRKATISRIRWAINNLHKKNIPVSVTEIVRLTGLSKATVYRYRDLVGDENIRGYTKFDEFFYGVD